MKIIISLFLNILLFTLIFSLDDFNYYFFATKALSQFSNKIVAAKAKSNKTKCYAQTDIKINDTLFQYKKGQILSSETCYHPQKEEIIKNLTLLINDTYEQNKIILSFCIYYILSDPDNNVTQISRFEKFNILSLPIDEVKYSELFFEPQDIDEFLVSGDSNVISESEKIANLIDKILNISDRKNDSYVLYTKIYYYLSTHSFNFSGNVIILPFIDVCNVVPYYLYKNSSNHLNFMLVEEDNNIIVKSKANISQSDQFSISYNISFDNDYLMAKQGVFSHNNFYDKYIIHKIFSYPHIYESNELYHNLKRHNLDPNLLQFKRENRGYGASLSFELFANKTSDYLYRFGIIYFFWWKTYAHDELSDYRHIAKQSLTFILRMCYDEIKEIIKRMKVGFEQYLLRTQNDKNLTELNKKLRNFNLEKVHLLHKNLKFLYNDLVILNYNEIKQNKNKYMISDTNTDI